MLCSLRDEGLIYRDLYLVNLCPRCLTAITDDEVEQKEVQGTMWSLRSTNRNGARHAQ